ncbi:methylmalonyl Co-A mutase-associated GTPase MeaB [Acidiferrimicrobium sp. IK]|uniref:methylmalonyl Co-A mutase-associated GTPase MeaB n=1 Tax=Acidiferrimicrobium sp. IK TaxID=2871700 RepID=UPI0021CB401E|nr:methylmalonyl Co-A mutase-associated GTPase MeaB [Acidiferrimicrobium sp. IK]MCU4186504.1 methylmalonyl Co-A mutase-associated GTPase MeaB [Acidiferrimicrobium sp. IK]
MAEPTPPSRRSRRDPEELLRAAQAGDRAATGRLLSLVERGGAPARAVGRLTFAPSAAIERVVGVTGAPGAGKSTLTDRLIAEVRATGRQVGVLAIDPSSPFSGGAILGDRVRMQGHATDDGVFIRSMATRGHLGGLALAAPEAVRVLGAVGLPVVLIETVGVGQVEVEIAGKADTTIVVVNPGWGDSVQANKAGLLEIADIFVINKADRPGAAETRRDLDNMLDLDTHMGAWRPPILSTVAHTGEGVDELWATVDAHVAHLEATGELAARRRRRLEDEMGAVVLRLLERDVRELEGGARWAGALDDVVGRRVDPYQAAINLIGSVEGTPPAR